MTKQFWIILLVIAVILGGVFVATKDKNGSTTAGSKSAPTEHIEGSNKTGVKLVEYGDYQCPACGTFYTTVHQVTDTYRDRIQFQFRNLPLTQLHPNAFSAARAAEAAGLQGKYFEMHDMLYNNQNTWAQSTSPLVLFEQYAKQLGLNVTTFKADYASSKVNDAINADSAAFAKTGAEMATPSFFINGKQVNNSKLVDAQGQPSVEQFSKVIDEAIAAQAKQ